MSHINYSHLYYLWHVYKGGSVVGAAEVLYLTSQIITRQIWALEERPQGKLSKRKERGLEPSELGGLVCRCADKMFALNQEMLDIVNHRRESNLLFDVGMADVFPKRLVSNILDVAVVENEQIYLRYSESTHEILLEQLSQHRLDIVISDCPIDFTQQEGLLSVKIGGCDVSLWCTNSLPEKPFPAYLEERCLLILGRRSVLGRKLLSWLNSQGLDIGILGEFDGAALVKAFGATHNATFVAPSLYVNDFYNDNSVMEAGRVESVMEEYHATFAGGIIQHPAVQHICNADCSALFTPTSK